MRWNYSGLRYMVAPNASPSAGVAFDGHTPLLGFPGVSVGLREDVLGTIVSYSKLTWVLITTSNVCSALQCDTASWTAGHLLLGHRVTTC